MIEILREYSRYFIGERFTDTFAQGLLALERNWNDPLLANQSVNTTLQQFQALERQASPAELKNWRFQQALYRAYYDAYTRARLLHGGIRCVVSPNEDRVAGGADADFISPRLDLFHLPDTRRGCGTTRK